MNPATIQEPARSMPVRGEYDVIVCGGGLGGTAAAMAAARAGAKTLLIERNAFLGGVATAGMCCSIFNCYYTAGHRRGTTGIAVEVADATGDADIAASAGAPVHICEKGVHSLCFRLGNVEVDAFVSYFREHPDQFPEYMDVDWSLAEALAQYADCGTFLFPHGGGMQMEAFQRAKASGELPATIGIQDTTDACQMHALRQTGVVQAELRRQGVVL